MSLEPRIAVTGMGVITSIAADVPSFSAALRAGRSGLQTVSPRAGEPGPPRVLAPVTGFSWREAMERHADHFPEGCARAVKILRAAPRSMHLGVCAALQAMADAGLWPGCGDERRIGVIVGGSNLHLRSAWDAVHRYGDGAGQVSPRHALHLLDTLHVGALTEIFGCHGPSLTVGGASASGHVALFQAFTWLRAGVLDACLVLGANMDLSPLELEAFNALGALGGEGWETRPTAACRPFDRAHGGFIWGEGSGAVVLERADRAVSRGAARLGELLGVSLVMDGNHLPDSSVAGEVRAMQEALASAARVPADIGYLNAHGTGTPLGDRTECAAIRAVFGDGAGRVAVNATKSMIGHSLSAAGVIEFIACLLQMNGGFLHGTLNLDDPIDPTLDFVAGPVARAGAPAIAMSNGFGFGGFNSSMVIQRGEI